MKRRSWLRWFVYCLLLGFALLFLFIGVMAAISWHCDLQGQIRPPTLQPQDRKAATADIKGYSRPEEDTYLSYPEWYIVWSYQEKADFQAKNLPSEFPYFGAVRQFWNGPCCISQLTHGKYAFNVIVIGTSFSAEYILKGAYEKTIGRLSEWTSSHQPVEEDQYAYRVAREYAEFVHIRPFYEFPFAHQVKGLWSETGLWGARPIRKWERKIFLTTDYTIEAFYSWLIEKLSHLSYGYEPAETYAWIDNADDALLRELPRVKTVKGTGLRAFIVALPRYQEFTNVASQVAERDVHFLEIAGNSQIILSVVAPEPWQYDQSNARQLFSTPILTQPELKRVIIGCDVTSLHGVLNLLHSGGMTVEHIYDY